MLPLRVRETQLGLKNTLSHGFSPLAGDLQLHPLLSFSKHLGYIVLVGSGTSADSFQNRLISNLREISTLDISRNTVQGSSQSILRRSVHHLGSDWGSVRRPSEKDNLGSLTLTSTNLVLEIVDSILTLVLWQLLQESVIVLAGGGLLYDNLGLLVVQGENDKLELLAQLQFVEGSQRLVSNSDTGG